MKHEYFTYTVEVAFHEPWDGVWMKGTRLFGCTGGYEEMEETVARHDAYYKEKYGKHAYCRLIQIAK